ncbi:MAG: hypothetical protein JWP65_3054 [Ramlibacter sp.]|jgi:hypothetical protein|uniref:YXWGXW repeat-containing protein n=1 Tax=Ramlibacter sp. TaxID=1917967 RepID=UPI00262BB459|nr:YXWGXW repeat-containing protein [Ramlibacter sp.]MDB5752633.1 hypothetical protein [Ramlibacter sp.]
MNRNTSIAAAVAAASLLGLAPAAHAVPAVVAPAPQVIVLQSAPPPAVYEQVPAARPGYIWAPGHYEWRDGRYAWSAGRWIDERPGWRWQEARWLQGPDGSWHLLGGQWVRTEASRDDPRVMGGPRGDQDGDGVANQDDRDRDGDGVRNRDDDFPRDPTRN